MLKSLGFHVHNDKSGKLGMGRIHLFKTTAEIIWSILFRLDDKRTPFEKTTTFQYVNCPKNLM